MFTIFKKRGIVFSVLIIIAFFPVTIYARAGGGGDFSSGDSGGEGIGTLIYILVRIIIELPFPFNVIVGSGVTVGFVIVTRLSQKKLKEQSILNQLPTGNSVKSAKGYSRFIAANPDFDEEVFKQAVRETFVKVQKAWEKQNVSEIRRVISDGVYQRFNTQFKMMSLLKQKNIITDITVKNVYIDRVESDGAFDIVHTAIHASLHDRYISELDSSLNTGGYEEFVEYWSFIKKRGNPRKDMYFTNNCPNCGSPLPADMGELAQCFSCNTITNSGEYDWVLSEITQADDYIAAHPRLSKSRPLTEKIQQLIDENEDFAVQLVEDKASNGYLQILTAIALNDPSIMRRFVSDDFFAKFTKTSSEQRIAYNRLFLNDVTLIGVVSDATMNILAIAVKCSSQRVRLLRNSIEKIDPVVFTKTDVMLLGRDKDFSHSRGSLYAHQCSSCGAPVANSLDITCNYCGTPLNSTKGEWIVLDILSPEQYSEYEEKNKNFIYRKDIALLDKLMDVRDFAFNNVMVVMAADGVFHDDEKKFAQMLAQKWGYNTEKLEPFFEMAKSGQLTIRMPQDVQKIKKIFRLMKKAASIDREMTREEKEALDRVKASYGIE
ncbi:MAG: TIM44-like domain-containing protein [Spirochaetes bacterium]|nr:TIM44-like domain-containing protein [Spirochaetota bacterium]